jgi:hypothetical protein
MPIQIVNGGHVVDTEDWRNYKYNCSVIQRKQLSQVKRLPASSMYLNCVTRDRCYDYLNIFAEKFGEKIGVFDSKQS